MNRMLARIIVATPMVYSIITILASEVNVRRKYFIVSVDI